jgi:FixJ family two-component response regulator
LEAGVAINSVIAIVDDDQSVGEGTRDLIEAMGFVARDVRLRREVPRIQHHGYN